MSTSLQDSLLNWSKSQQHFVWQIKVIHTCYHNLVFLMILLKKSSVSWLVKLLAKVKVGFPKTWQAGSSSSVWTKSLVCWCKMEWAPFKFNSTVKTFKFISTKLKMIECSQRDIRASFSVCKNLHNHRGFVLILPSFDFPMNYFFFNALRNLQLDTATKICFLLIFHKSVLM